MYNIFSLIWYLSQILINSIQAEVFHEWRDGRYWSTTFYAKMSPEEVVEDIKRGHDIFCQVFGKAPVGFRAPHLGTYQSEEQRALIYDTLKELGYRYSTSTIPKFGLDHGPVVDVGDLYEIPLSGSYAGPFTILDSWSNIQSPEKPVVKSEYASLFIQTVDRLLDLSIPGVLNYYVDPAHVVNSEAFYQAVEYLIKRDVQTIEFETLLALCE